MGIYEKLADDIQEVDIIIAGGGTAACIVAGRIAAAAPNLSVLVIEGGQNNYMNDNVVNPALYLEHQAPTSKTTIFYQGNESKALAGRKPIVPSGGILGGGSSINFMMYTRAQRQDFDSWNTKGWSSEELWPYLKKLETYHGVGSENDHGYSGPVQISDGGYRAMEAENEFMNGAIRAGYSEIKDLQNLEANDGFERWNRYASPEGKRQDAAHTYLHPVLNDGKHPNLHVLVKSKVLRVLLNDQKRAVGVEYIPNPAYQDGAQSGIGLPRPPKLTVRAKRLVVVSCGACGTPSVLERSGIGSAAVLSKAGVPQVVELPGVGSNYEDHNLLFYPYKTNLDPSQTLDGLFSGRFPREQLLKERPAILGWNGIDVASKLRPTEAEVKALGPEFEVAWERDFKKVPNKPLMLMAQVSAFLGDHSTVPPGQYVSVATYTAYPYSRGHLHITGPALEDPLDFDLGFFTDENDIDLKKLVWAYKRQREVMRRTNYYRGELAVGHPKFPAGSRAACVEVDSPLGIEGKEHDLPYSAEDDAAIEQFLRENVATTWHSIGTCRMAPKNQGGVVDPDLNVYGVEGLKLIDLSIAPQNVGANTNNTALLVGEMGAGIILKELGLHSADDRISKYLSA